MNDKNIRTVFECTDGNGGWDYPTMKEALEQRIEMRKGFPKNTFMSDENKSYWKNAAKRYFITKVVTTTEVII